MSKKIILFLLTTILFTFGISNAVRITNTVNGRELPIYSVETEKKQISLTFDSAWGNEDLDSILETLQSYHVSASFFVTGEWVANYPNEVQKIHANGHDLGNHSEHHKNMSQLTSETCTSELLTVHERMKNLIGVEMNIFRPPYGDYNDTVIKTAASCGYFTIQWSVDSLDWKDYGIDSIIKTVTKHPELKNGAIILLHTGSKYTAEALPLLIEQLQAQGYEFVPVSKLIYTENYHLDVTGRQFLN
jgi:polysaccharide deacetylase family sporulation protein PdaB